MRMVCLWTINNFSKLVSSWGLLTLVQEIISVVKVELKLKCLLCNFISVIQIRKKNKCIFLL